MTIQDLLDQLDGAGLVVTDDELIAQTLADQDLTPETEIYLTPATRRRREHLRGDDEQRSR